MSTFDITKQSLKEILGEITKGTLQLPDFQRGWIWDDAHIRDLLVSVARSFPVGAIMLLETGGEVEFEDRPIENVNLPDNSISPDRLILDGQQRLTSLTQVLALDTPVKTKDEKGKAIKRYYYINIQDALDDDNLENSFIGIEEDKTVKKNFGRDIELDLSTQEKEFEEFYFPCNQILNSDAWESDLHKIAPDKFGQFLKFREKVLAPFRNYQLPIIELGKETTKEGVCLVFEKVNTGGVALSTFELVTAAFAADSFNLRDDWHGNTEREVEGREKRIQNDPILASTAPTEFLQAISLLVTYEKRQADIVAGKTGKAASAISAKRATVLDLRLEDYKKFAKSVEEGFMSAAKFLRKECFSSQKDIPYSTQVVPLAALMAKLGEKWLEPKIYDKVSQWYWCGVFGELYGGTTETRISNDFEDMMKWIEDDDATPRTVYNASFQSSRLLTLRTRQSAAYKGLNTIILREGAKDLFWKATIRELDREEKPIDIHHIFPRDWCKNNGVDEKFCDSVINKTPISYKANRKIGGRAPSAYLKSIASHKQVQLSAEEMDELVASHRIDPESMRNDDFATFFKNRKEALLAIIETAMKKKIERDEQEDND